MPREDSHRMSRSHSALSPRSAGVAATLNAMWRSFKTPVIVDRNAPMLWLPGAVCLTRTKTSQMVAFSAPGGVEPQSPVAKLLIGGGVTVVFEMLLGGHFIEFLKIAKVRMCPILVLAAILFVGLTTKQPTWFTYTYLQENAANVAQ